MRILLAGINGLPRWSSVHEAVLARPVRRRPAELAPAEPEVHGLDSLMELQASRLRARVGAAGVPVLLDQDRARGGDRVLIGSGLAALERAQALGGALGPYCLQAAIAAATPPPREHPWQAAWLGRTHTRLCA